MVPKTRDALLKAKQIVRAADRVLGRDAHGFAAVRQYVMTDATYRLWRAATETQA